MCSRQLLTLVNPMSLNSYTLYRNIYRDRYRTVLVPTSMENFFVPFRCESPRETGDTVTSTDLLLSHDKARTGKLYSHVSLTFRHHLIIMQSFSPVLPPSLPHTYIRRHSSGGTNAKISKQQSVHVHNHFALPGLASSGQKRDRLRATDYSFDWQRAWLSMSP